MLTSLAGLDIISLESVLPRAFEPATAIIFADGKTLFLFYQRYILWQLSRCDQQIKILSVVKYKTQSKNL